MLVRKLSLETTIRKYTNENGFAWGINTVMESLAPSAKYNLVSAGGTFVIEKWDSLLPQPTEKEIREEYIRQETIAECTKIGMFPLPFAIAIPPNPLNLIIPSI